ncbi:MAG: hypothetical protein UV54_C0006G0017 [Candidatus Beckwithbacteria bacterium GW2011_GWA2_43_10]|uniref:Nucleotidyl transferase AbiEii/AbiGii toxin family protein n=1 Tax=Candidatus Beckwithbacteria bacterium GW2011_GWA2_43_10 TaxID=1618369 RepID=A0A0G1C4F7_9BACT|nr:MAG: hypothetical protein UV54_C0006G0017 [Candidatus Beckwithbacteria bacterium GW2011_GWA2_43_10]
MGKTSVLDSNQKRFLALVLKEPYIIRHFYWTGGTVLAEFYLKHRESYDIDLFSDKEIHLPSVSKFVSLAGGQLKAKSIIHRQFLGLHTFIFKFPTTELKVDFNYYPFLRINIGQNWRGLEIDSLEDIAANKVHTIAMKARERDFVDLYFIMKQSDYSLPRLIDLARAKFDWPIDPVQLGQTLTKVVAFKDLPKMLKPLDFNQMEEFFLKLAKSLEGEIFK